IDINTDASVNNLVVNSANVTARLNTNALDVINDITISAGTLSTNNLGLSLGGNWNNSGTFTPGTGIVTFDGSSAQSIFKNNGETFNSLLFTGAGVKTFSSPVTTNANFSVSSGSSVDVSTANYSLTVKGNFINSGTFTARTGLVMLNGTTAQVIGGSSVTDFYNLSLNNSAGASLSNAENLKGTLTLSGGTFNANGQVFTMISDASGTARIAQITGTGDYIGNVTVQRYAPGGTTGWAFLGSPLSSALTLNDWDDDIYISCPTCPDGSAGGFLSVYSYSEAATGVYDSPGSYIAINTINDAISSGRGYWVYLGNGPSTTSDITLDLTGTPRKSSYSIPLSYSNYGSAANDGWNLICNPYPSAISWTSLRGATSNIDNAIYVYNADLNSGSGGFATYVNGISSPAVASGGIGDNIPMGQGFYVHSTGATALNAQESNKVANDPTFLKPTSSATSNLLTRVSLKGAITGDDETVLYFQPGASDQFDDAYDSYKMPGQDPYAPSIALEKGGKTFQVNGVAPVSGNFSMPLKTLTGYTGSYTISASDLNSFPKGACINLYDKFTATTTDLRTSDYVFTLEDTTTVARFDLNITINSLNASINLLQPSCSQASGGKVVAVGNNAGPWNYYWKINNVTVQTSLNKAGADSLINLNQGVVSLEMSTSGSCDNFETDFNINEQTPVQAQFNSIDTVFLNATGVVQFSNTSVNSMYNSWNFGDNTGSSQASSPSYTYTSEGSYSVKLICISASGCMDSTSKTLVVMSEALGLFEQNTVADKWVLKNLGNGDYVLSGLNSTNQLYSFDLYDAQGRLVRSYGKTATGKVELNIQLTAEGLYFLNLRSDKERSTLKLLR
ncbi:MAG: T9SS type A sorting domain-containing protein, partial [Bacteroidia bacterium]|nr:T9SS type A sorting domain-containing protein [Bacteroidia bacterium]